MQGVHDSAVQTSPSTSRYTKMLLSDMNHRDVIREVGVQTWLAHLCQEEINNFALPCFAS